MERPVNFFRRLRASLADAGGSSTIVFSVAAAVLVGCAGMAVDYGRAKLALNAVQNNLDAAVLAGVASSLVEKHQIRTAETYFKRFAEESGTNYAAKFAVKKGVLTGSVEATVQTSLLRVLDINQMSLKATAAATAEAALEPLCFMAMHPTRKHTLELKGSVSVIAPDCNIYGNSNHEFDVVDPHTQQNFMKAKFVAAIGGGHHYLQNVTPPVEFGTKLVEEPLASLPLPAAPACTATGTSISGKTMTLAPGHYCGGLKIIKGSKVELQEGGTYYISGGAFDILSSQLTGKDVTIFLMDSRATVEWQKAVVRISAPRTGDYAGIAIFGERVETDNVFDASTIDIHGVFYMPMGALTWDNTGDPNITAKWTAFVVDGVSWIGSGTIRINFDRASSDVPYPEDLIAMPRPSKPRLIN